MTRARALLRGVQRLLPPTRGQGLLVLAYHLVEAGTPSAVDLPAAKFRDHLDELTEVAEVVSLAAGVLRLRRGTAAAGPSRPLVALTFDDAYRNFVEVAWPLLAERRLPATLFVPVGFVEGEAPPPNSAAPLPAASWDELAALCADGLDVGSHTWSHPDLTRLDDGAVHDELVRSRERLEERLGVVVSAFCYPRALWSPRVERQVGKVYDLAVIGGGGRTTPRRLNPLRIQRVSLRRDGPASLAGVLAAPVWLEERVADVIRRWRR